MDQVFISDLIACGITGVNDWEREKRQEILINIVLFTDLYKVGNSDNIGDSVNYRTVAKKVLARAETAQRQTVEALTADIALMSSAARRSASPCMDRKARCGPVLEVCGSRGGSRD